MGEARRLHLVAGGGPKLNVSEEELGPGTSPQ